MPFQHQTVSLDLLSNIKIFKLIYLTMRAFTEVRTTGSRLKMSNYNCKCNYNAILRYLIIVFEEYREESTLVVTVGTLKVWTEFISLCSRIGWCHGRLSCQRGLRRAGGLCICYTNCKKQHIPQL